MHPKLCINIPHGLRKLYLYKILYFLLSFSIFMQKKNSKKQMSMERFVTDHGSLSILKNVHTSASLVFSLHDNVFGTIGVLFPGATRPIPYTHWNLVALTSIAWIKWTLSNNTSYYFSGQYGLTIFVDPGGFVTIEYGVLKHHVGIYMRSFRASLRSVINNCLRLVGAKRSFA